MAGWPTSIHHVAAIRGAFACPNAVLNGTPFNNCSATTAWHDSVRAENES
jgi:hypothetical protein